MSAINVFVERKKSLALILNRNFKWNKFIGRIFFFFLSYTSKQFSERSEDNNKLLDSKLALSVVSAILKSSNDGMADAGNRVIYKTERHR